MRAARKGAREVSASLVWVCGTSMAPFLNPGDLILVEPVPERSLVPGTVVVFEGPGKILTVHRIVGCEVREGLRYFLTQGDNRSEPDPWIPSWKIVGKMRGKVLGAGPKTMGRGAELLSWGLSGVGRRVESLRNRCVQALAPLLARTMPIRILSYGLDGKEKVAYILGRPVAKRVDWANGIRFWVQPEWQCERLLRKIEDA